MSNESITQFCTNFNVGRKAKVYNKAGRKQLAEKPNISFALFRELYKKIVNKAINRKSLYKKLNPAINTLQQKTKQDQSPSHKISSSESEASNSFNFLAIS